MLRLFCLSALLACAPLVAAPAAAQDAETFFHGAAQSYIGKDVPEAKRQVEAGLRVAPSDPKLLALQKKLEQQQQQGGSSGQGQPQNQNQKDQQDGQSDEQQEDKDQEAAQEDEQQGNEPQEEQQQPEDPQEGEQESPGDASEAQPGETQQEPPPDPGALTEAQAERILQALQNQEKQLLREVQRGRPVRGRPTDKDW